MAVRNYQNSRTLDVHRWSDHPEVNSFVNSIYNDYFANAKTSKKDNQAIRKKHLKVVLLDLYVCWYEDPSMHIAVHMSPNAYSNGHAVGKVERYNELKIKRSTIDVIHRLTQVRLIGFKKGWQDPKTLKSFLSRIWASSKLIKLFEDAAFGYFHIRYSRNREVIQLKDADKKLIDYDNSPKTEEMRKVLMKYNALLEKTFIDIPSLDRPTIVIDAKDRQRRRYKDHFVHISHQGKFVYRVFNNGSWEQGGRFYGGFWQRIGEKYRQNIRINEMATVEVDFSGLHIILAYAKEGIDYWKHTEEDPYAIPVKGINDPEIGRSVVKLLTLLALNASDETLLFKAFRSQFEYNMLPLNFSFTNVVLKKILSDIKERHLKISHLLGTGAGLELMNIDSQITEYIIKDFVKTDSPILTIHDSYVVTVGMEDRLERLMKNAFEYVTSKQKTKLKFNRNMTMRYLNQYKFSTGPDRDFYLDMLSDITKSKSPAKGYVRRLERHKKNFTRK